MQTRTRRTTASFSHPFSLVGLADVHPAGDYDIVEDEEAVQGPSWTAWRRIATFIHLPAQGERAVTRQMVAINHADLEAALELDRKRSLETENVTP